MRIDCTQCEMYESEHCEDCLVTAVLHPPAGPVEIDHDLDPPLRELAGAGLIPVLKFRPRKSGSAGPQDGRGAGSTGPQDGRGAGSTGPQDGLDRKAN
jgi:hypothetical protein